MLRISITVDGDIEFVKNEGCSIVFMGSSIAQDNYATNHMNICPYMYRKYGISCATLGISAHHTFFYDEVVQFIRDSEVRPVLMDIAHCDEKKYLWGKDMIGGVTELIPYPPTKYPQERQIMEKHCKEDSIIRLSADCMWDNSHLNDLGTVEYCKRLIEVI